MDLGLSIACLQHAPFEGPGAIADWARQRHHRLALRPLHAGAALPRVGEFDWLMLLGGPMGVADTDAHPWLAAERALVREAVAAGRTVVGVCLGAQQMAAALGAPVGRSPEREIGWWPVEFADDSHGVATGSGRATVFHWHGDAFALPPGARRLASSEGCPEQAFILGDRALGLQFHLETTPALVEGLLQHCAGDLAPGRFVQDAATLRAGTSRHLPGMHALLASLLDGLPGAGRFLVTERLVLRRLRADDLPRLLELDSDPEVMRWIDGGRPPDATRMRGETLPRLLGQYGAWNGLGFFAAETRGDGGFLGWFHLRPWQGDSSVLELGWRLKRAAWGRGLATEAGRHLVRAAFDALGAHRVVATAMAANEASLRVMSKCGLAPERSFEEHRFPGPDRRAMLYALDAANRRRCDAAPLA